MEDEMIPMVDAARMLGVGTSTARAWAINGKLRGAAQVGAIGCWCAPRLKVPRLRDEREADGHQTPADWIAMTEREGAGT